MNELVKWHTGEPRDTVWPLLFSIQSKLFKYGEGFFEFLADKEAEPLLYAVSYFCPENKQEVLNNKHILELERRAWFRN